MKHNVLKLLAIIIVLSLTVAFFCACSNPAADEPKSADTQKAAADLSVGLLVERLGDNSLSDMLYNAVKKAQEKHGFQLDVSECGSGDMSMTLQDYTKSEEYDLIIMMYHALDVAIEMQEQYPNQKYLVYDVSCEGQKNIASLSYAKNEMGFIAGVFAALMEDEGTVTLNGNTVTLRKTNQFGSLIGVNLPSTVGAITGYEAGIKYIHPELPVQTAEIGSWADQAAAKELALTMFNSGIDILFHNAGGSALGALEAAKTLNWYMIGYDANQNNLDKDHILASSHKNHDAVIGKFFDEYVNGIFNGGTNTVNSYANNGILLTYQDNLVVPESVSAAIDEIKSKLASGEIVPPSSVEELALWTETYSK